MPSIYLSEFSKPSIAARESLLTSNQEGFDKFCRNSKVIELGWPPDVVEQLLYEHGDNESFLKDYGELDLSLLAWSLEAVSIQELVEMPTGPSDGDYIEEIASNPDHWINSRNLVSM